MPLQGCQIRAARAILRLSLKELAKVSGVSDKTLRRCESVDGVPPVHRNTLHRIQQAFENQGVAFIDSVEAIGPGLYLTWNPIFDKGPSICGIADEKPFPDRSGEP
ncbi:helix-turn-helix domain-containing protein [Methylobacterium sp. WL103]|uniref:helix-turn-helix domain-containing protein n=1 Tax=Methylobacterium sp. WL103 TaxID=2603891 RepID=UPI0011CA7F16|nr:helix-turn-helix transcriptional regulator [Methylobacterium sp. WL103]TXN07942.1 helix-turn-helix domain-containing protein [Methylobacterium sp. WL103]